MRESAVDDYDAIRKRLEEIKSSEPEAERTLMVPDADNEKVCGICGGDGWVMVYDPPQLMYDICPFCYNPENRPSP